MYHLKDGLERVFVKEELMFIPKDTELLPDFVKKNGETSKMSFPTPEQGSVWVSPKVPTKVIYHIGTDGHEIGESDNGH